MTVKELFFEWSPLQDAKNIYPRQASSLTVEFSHENFLSEVKIWPERTYNSHYGNGVPAMFTFLVLSSWKVNIAKNPIARLYFVDYNRDFLKSKQRRILRSKQRRILKSKNLSALKFIISGTLNRD